MGINSVLAAASILGLAISAQAGVTLTYTVTQLDGGFKAYDFSLVADDGLSLSTGVSAVTFTGVNGSVINQMVYQKNSSSALVSVNSFDMADTYDGLGRAINNGESYSKDYDSWFYSPWSDNTLTPGIVENGTTSYAISAGSGIGNNGSSWTFAHIVSNGDIAWTGSAVRNQAAFDISGTTATATPEPASIAVLAIAGAGLLARRRR